jgi:ABC-type uncharacterized transport system substrate-binding protein
MTEEEILKRAFAMPLTNPAFPPGPYRFVSVVGPLLQATRTVPIVFTQTPDPIGAGFVDSLARPGGNATGFSIFDYSIAGKWLELLKQIAPAVTRVAVIRDPATPQGIGQFSAVHAVAPSLGLDVSPINASEPSEVERAIKTSLMPRAA